MILRRELIARVLRSQVAEWRHPPGALSFSPGHSYTMKTGAKRREVARAIVLDVREQFLHQLSDADAANSGFASAYELWEWWFERYREGWGHRRPQGKPIPIRIEVVALVLDTSHRPRLLSRRSEFGYTDRPELALAEEPEAVPEATHERFAERAREEDKARLRAELADFRELPLVERLRDALRSARAAHVDVNRELRVIEQRVEQIKRRALGARA